MKTDIYTLLGMIKDGKAPKKIHFGIYAYEYKEGRKDYYHKEDGYLFDGYIITDILNEEVEILETTVTISGQESGQQKKIEKLKRIEERYFDDDLYKPEARINVCMNYIDNITGKINEIIDYINKEEK